MPVKHSYLAANDVLQPGDYLVSPSGKYVASLKENGQLSLCYTVQGSSEPDWNRCYWQSPVSPGNQPWGVMQEDGNFVLYDGPQVQDPDHPDPAYFASCTPLYRALVTTLLDDGNLVVCTGVPPGDPEEIVWSALPQISAGCKFMQNYRVTVPVNGGAEILAIRNKAGEIELFTLGNTGDIHTFWPDATSETGYSQAALTSGIHFSHLAGGADADGNVVLFASSGQIVYSLAETSDPQNRWGTPQPIFTPSIPVTDIVARSVGGALWLLAIQKTSGGLYQPAVMRWGSDDKLKPNAGIPFDIAPLAFLEIAGSPAEPTAAFVTAGKIVLWGLTSGRVAGWAADTRVPSSLAVTADGTGAEWVIAVLPDGQLYRLAAAGSSYVWNQLCPPVAYADYPVKFQEVVAETDASGGVHVFAVAQRQAVVDGDPTPYNVLYHLAPNEPAGTQPVPVCKSNGMMLAGVANDSGSIDLFAVSAGNQVTHLFSEMGTDGTNWIEERVLDPADDTAPITEYSSYATDITLYDGDQSVLAYEPVDIYAADRTRVEVNGLTFFIDELRPASVTTDASGMLRISQETGSLASPLLRVKLSAARMPDKAPIIIVEPYADVQRALADQTGQKLLDAKVTNDDGTQSDLLQGTYRDGTTPDSLAQALENFMGVTANKGELDDVQSARLAARAQVHMAGGRPTARGSRPSVAERNRFWSRQEPHPGGLRHAGALRPGRPARLTFPDAGFSYEPLTAAEAAEHAQQLATLPDVSATGFLSWISSIGDAFRAVADGIAKVAQIVWDGLNAAFELVVDGISYAFNAVVQFIEDAFDMVEMIFNHVKVFFETLYKWLAWLFDWTSIKQTSKFVANSFNEMMRFLKEAVEQLGPKVDSGFATFKTQFADMMDDAIKKVAGQYTIGGYEQRNASSDPDADSATSNNFFFNEFVSNNGDSGPTQALAAELGSSDPISTLTSLLTDLTTVEEASIDSFNQALDYFRNLGKEPDQIFKMAFAGMLSALKGIGLVGLDLASKIVDALLQAMSDVIDTFSNVVKQKISIPFVSTFYKWATGDDLTLLNVVSMATAIPSAIIYKITTGDSLFTADSGPGSAQDFTSVVTCDNMLAATGLTPASSSPRSAASPIQNVTKRMAYGMAGTYLTVTYIGGLLTAVGEIKDAAPTAWQGPLGWISYAGVGCGILSAVFSFPWFYADTGAETTAEGVLFMTMGLSIVIGTFIETRSINFPPSTINDIRAIAFTVGGTLMLAHAASSTKGNPDRRVPAWAILQRIPWAVKFLRLSAVSAATYQFSVFVLVAIDHLCGLSSGVLGYLVLRERYDVAATQHAIKASSA
jgi:hypothetical protein